MRVAVIGSGYAGLVTGLGLAKVGHHVGCVDIDAAKVAALNAGDAVIFESGLAELLRAELRSGRFRATTDLGAAAAAAQVVFLCVGTPSAPDGRIDTTDVVAAAEQVGVALRRVEGFPVVVVKSTVVPGTTAELIAPAIERTSGRVAGVDIGIGVNPEFLTEGQALADFVKPDRIVLGGDDKAVAILRELYAPFAGVPVVATNTGTAEMIKYASNALLATAISFANEIAAIGAAVGGVDAREVMRGVHLSRYLTSDVPGAGPVTASLAAFLQAGCGYGGSCLPKDVTALAARGAQVGASARLLEAVTAVNADQPMRLVRLVEDEFGELTGLRVAVLGLAFKPYTDDLRNTPAFPVISGLVAGGADVVAHDPVVGPEAVAGFDEARVSHTSDLPLALKDADAVVLVTRWDEYRELPALLRDLDDPPLVVDGRRMLDKDSIDRYRGIGL